MAGLFFCLASAEGAGLLFCPTAIQPHTSVYSAFCAVNAIFTIHTIKQHTELCSGFSCDYARSSAHDTRQTQAAIIPPVPSWSVSQRRNTSSAYQDTTATPDAVQLSTADYYNKVYKSAPPVMDLCQTVQHIADHASPAGSAPTVCGSLASAAPGASAEGSTSPPVQGQPGGAVQQQGAAGGAEPLTATAVSLFGLSPDS